MFFKKGFIFFSYAVAFISIFFFSTQSIFAESPPVINEFLAHPSSGNKEWVEFYNPDHIDLSGYWIDDDTDFSNDTGNALKKQLSSIDTSNPIFPVFTLSSSMFNNTCSPSCDYVTLFSSDGTLLDQYQYTSEQIQEEGKSIGRSPDGSNNWFILAAITKGAGNSVVQPTPSPSPSIVPTSTNTPTPTKTPTPTPTPKPTATPTKSPTPTLKPSAAFVSPVSPTSEQYPTSVLGESTDNQPTSQPTIAKDIKVLGDKQSNLSKILIGIGIIFLIACGVLAFRSYKRNREGGQEFVIAL